MLRRTFASLSLVIATTAACSAGPSELSDAQVSRDSTGTVVRLPGDLTKCPGKYHDQAPIEGQNTGFSVDDQSREFWMLLPPGDAATPHPLFVAFNGTGGNGKTIIDQAHLADLAARGFIVVAPSSIGNGTVWPVWDGLRQPGTEDAPNKDLDYFDSLVACVAAHHSVDEDRVFIGGHSAGGIMTNYVLQRRSSLLAGGIVASGVFSLTSPVPAQPLDPMFVLVTWGGSNDRYQGSTVTFDFVSEAALATQHYDAATGVTEVNCQGDHLGHTWLWRNNSYFVDLLLSHPKGHAALEGPLPDVPADAQATCSNTPFTGHGTPDVVCPASQHDGCREMCQFVGDCAVENTTIQPALHDQIVALGFSGDGNTECGGCVGFCDSHGTGSDPAVLACFKERQASAQCGQGIEGVIPLVDAVNECCRGRTDSPLCVDVCNVLLTQPQAASFFSSCQDITGSH